MAQKKQVALRKKELVAQLAKSRKSITRAREEIRAGLKQKLQIKNQLKRLITRKPKALFAGSVLAGLTATLLLRRPRKSPKKPPLTPRQMLLAWLLSLLKPAAKAWLVSRAKKLAADQIEARARMQAAARHD